MTDPELIEKKLARIETCVRELTELGRPDRLSIDVREERFVEHTLQLAIQAALDAASHVVSDERLGEPRTRRDLFELLRRAGWIPAALSASLGDLAELRDALVHGYDEVDLAIVRDVLENHVSDLLDFVAAMRERRRAA